MSVVNKLAELFGLPTQEMYDDLLNDYMDLSNKYEELLKWVNSTESRSRSPYIKVEDNIFKYFNRFVVRTTHKKKRYSKSFDTIEEARAYLKEVKQID